MTAFTISPHIFLAVSDNKLILWDYRQHRQHDIYDERYLQRLFVMATSPRSFNDEIEKDLLDAGIIEPRGSGSGSQGPAWKWDLLSRIFHEGTKHIIDPSVGLPLDDSDEIYSQYLEYCESIYETRPIIETERSGPQVALPAPSTDQMEAASLWDVLSKRKSTRTFERKSIDIQIVSNILYSTFGNIHGDHKSELQERGITTLGYRRSSPSAGSLQASEPYLVALDVSGLARGVYHYRSHDHRLTCISEGVADKLLGGLLSGQAFSNELGFAVFITSRFDKLWWKYPHSRAYRSALLDVGHLSQTFLLSATAHGLSTWLTGYFYDGPVHEFLQVDGCSEQVIFLVGAGYGDGDSLAPAVKRLVERARQE